MKDRKHQSSKTNEENRDDRRPGSLLRRLLDWAYIDLQTGPIRDIYESKMKSSRQEPM